MLPPIKKFLFLIFRCHFLFDIDIEHSVCQLKKRAENAFKQGFRPLSRIQKLRVCKKYTVINRVVFFLYVRSNNFLMTFCNFVRFEKNLLLVYIVFF